MYEAHFGLRQRPFAATPDVEVYYPATGHEQALAQLAQALQDDEAFAVLTGAPGTGKTLLGQRLLEQLCPDGSCAFLTHGHFGEPAGLLRAIHYDLGLAHEGRSEQELRLALTDHLLKNYTEGRRLLLVLDEAQLLVPPLLEEVRLLGNLEGRRGKALQVVLLGQEPLGEMLKRPELAALRQRVGAHARLAPLGLHEAVDYLAHHLRQAGGRPEAILTDEALEILARGTRGVPRLLNRAAHAALRLAFQAGAETVDAEAALESLTLSGLTVDEQLEPCERGVDASTVFADTDEPAQEDGPTPAAVLALDAAPQKESPGKPASRRRFAAPKRTA